ncbi:MAG TPA: FAD-dependent oxidoreductase [Woeseiaceae bacterium]|nr:FAD-dependent oxidoreductase [Woeseiaceae bacterium]
MTITRRQFVHRIGAMGFGAAFVSMQALGMLPDDAAGAVAPSLAAGSGKGKSVVILGAGVSGLATAFELRRAGYEVTILEASNRCGGRNLTVRGGDVVQQLNGVRQECNWDEGLYFNAGPSRISSQHKRVLHYCREFSIPLEVQITTNRAALYHDDGAFGGRAIENRQLHYDTRGYVSELLSKCVHQGALDEELTADDKRALVEFLQGFGDLGSDGSYDGSPRAGYARFPGGGMNFGKKRQPLAFKDLLNVKFWGWMFNEDEIFGHQATMFQPVGGIDKIVVGFTRQLPDGLIRTNCTVVDVRNSDDAVEIRYRQTEPGSLPVFENPQQNIPHQFDFNHLGELRTIKADFCVTTIPYAGYKYIENNFSATKKRAIEKGQHYENSVKTAWKSRRWWEEDLGIYGGVTYTTRDIEQIWYPSEGFFNKYGTLVTSYNDGDVGHQWHMLAPEERAALARTSTDHVHPGYGKDLTDPVSVAWRTIPFIWGAWPAWEPDDSAEVTRMFSDIIRPEGRVYFAGDIASLWAGWMEGAFAAAHTAVNLISRRVAGSQT